MRAYELMVLIDPEVDERTVEPTLGKFLDVVLNDGGTIEKVDIWGRRRLAYDIQKKNEAIYAVVNFTATPLLPQSLTASWASTRPSCAPRSPAPKSRRLLPSNYSASALHSSPQEHILHQNEPRRQ